jgi:hypothetical protein
MKHVKYIILTLIITFFSITGKTQIIISADSFYSYKFFIEKNGIKDTFLITLKPSSSDSVKKNKDTNFYIIDNFKVKLAKIIQGGDTANVLKNFYRLDTVLGIKKYTNKNKKKEFLCSINQLKSPTPPPPTPTFWESINKKWFLSLLTIPLILMLFFRKKIKSILMAKDKKVAPQTETPDENDAATLTEKVHVIYNNEMDSNNISESDLKKENDKLKKENNEHTNKIKKYENEIASLKKTIESNNLTINEHETAKTAELAKQREQYDNSLKQGKQEFEKQLKLNEEKLSAIIAENKTYDEIISIIYEKYKFLNNEKSFDDNFDLGEIVEAAYFLNSATKNYLVKIPVLFKEITKTKFRNIEKMTNSDECNIDFIVSKKINNSVNIVDEDSIKRNQDLSGYIKILRKKLVEAKVKDVSNVIIENHRIKL